MKFCYLDESGSGSEPILVMAGVIVDASRMHVTKEHWDGVLSEFSRTTGKDIKEFHTREFYRGNGPWRDLQGSDRAAVIDAILQWVSARKHKLTFSAILKSEYEKSLASGRIPQEIPSMWCAAALHCLLGLQKHHQGETGTKGHTVVVFDREVKEEKRIAQLVLNAPAWTDEYYSRGKKQARLDQLIDVPYFADSEHALLVQVADLIAYVLRLYGEINEDISQESYRGERERLSAWVDQIVTQCIPQATRYPKKGRSDAAERFWEVAPASLRR